MDGEDEPNSYLKYLSDSDTPNTYLLGNNEMGLFSVEPIFTEMEATDWPQEGFPLLLTNSLITEDSTDNQDTSSQSSDKNLVNETLNQNNILEQGENAQESTGSTTDNKKTEIQNVIKIKSEQNEVQLDGNALELDEQNLYLDQEDVQLHSNEIPLNENCIRLESCLQLEGSCIQLNESDIQLSENTLQVNDTRLQLPAEGAEVTDILQLPEIDSVQLKHNENTLRNEVAQGATTTSLLSSATLPPSQNKTKSISDLFLTVEASKCKICGFLCQGLEPMRKHISEKHTKLFFTHNGISTGVSILLAKESPENTGVKEVYTVYVCSECHCICIDKNDLRQHMIQVHNLGNRENSTVPSTENQAQPVTQEETKSIYKKTTMCSDVTIGLVKKQERAMQQVKCHVSGCGASFPTNDLCNAHRKLHIGDKKNYFKCLECEQTFQMWRIARVHMYKDHGLDFGMIVCPTCSIFKSYKAVTMLRHITTHSEEKPFKCQECEKAFKQLAQLKNHEALHKTPEDMPMWCRLEKCDKCQRIFSTAKSLKKHIKEVHEKFKPFICNVCGHKSTRKALLELHVRQHTGNKPLKCNFCEFRTGDPNSLRKHKMKHLGAFSYQCPYCGYRCIQAVSIKNHMLRNHKGKDGAFSCKHCTYTTVSAMNMHQHESGHEIAPAEGVNSSIPSTSISEAERIDDPEEQTDEETQSCFLNAEYQMEETVDNGGITIPAGLEMDATGLEPDPSRLETDSVGLETDLAGLETQSAMLETDSSGLETDSTALEMDSSELEMDASELEMDSTRLEIATVGLKMELPS